MQNVPLATQHTEPVEEIFPVAGERRRNRRLLVEFLVLFIAAPVFLAVALPPSAMLPILLLVTVVGMILLHRTPGFAWRNLLRGWKQIDWRFVAGFAVLTVIASIAVLMASIPDRWFVVFRMSPWAWLIIMLLYPIVSALPQEIVFRPLFFRRYSPILPSGRAALLLNAGVFSLAHLLYWHWAVSAMTFVGGLIFAWAYETRSSFALAVVLHAVAGNILFTIGTGYLFYTGTIVRPF